MIRENLFGDGFLKQDSESDPHRCLADGNDKNTDQKIGDR